MNLKLYALFERNENRVFNIGLGVDDNDFCKWMLKQLNVAFNNIEKEEEKEPFFNRLRSCEILRLGEIDERTGELINDKQFLVDLKDLEFNEESEKK